MGSLLAVGTGSAVPSMLMWIAGIAVRDIFIYFDSSHRVAFLPQTAFRAELSGHPLAVWPSSFWYGVSRPRSKGRAGHRLHWYIICIIAGMFSEQLQRFTFAEEARQGLISAHAHQLLVLSDC